LKSPKAYTRRKKKGTQWQWQKSFAKGKGEQEGRRFKTRGG